MSDSSSNGDVVAALRDALGADCVSTGDAIGARHFTNYGEAAGVRPRALLRPRSVDDVSRALSRISHEILERNKGPEDLLLLGLHTRGVPLAHRIAAKIAEVEGAAVATGSLDVTMYRDDLRSHPTRSPHQTHLPPGGIDGKTVVLVDDVLFSGRTIRAALERCHERSPHPTLVAATALEIALDQLV